MDKFETLEDYQNSLKEFNERTRKSYEDFIQEYGDESQKLQLRCTPFTEKKGRYGVASLDFGFQIWQSRQAEVDQLNDVLGERTKEWLEAIECGIYFQEIAKPLKSKLDERDKRIGDQKDFIEMALNSLNHLKENAVTHRDYGHECNWVRSFNDLIKLADDAEDTLKQALRGERE